MIALTRKQRAFRNGLQAIWDYHSLPPWQPLQGPLQTPRYDRILLKWTPALQARIDKLSDCGFLSHTDAAVDEHRPLRHLGIDYSTAVKGNCYRETVPVLAMQIIQHESDLHGSNMIASPPLRFFEADIDIGGIAAITSALRESRKRDVAHIAAGLGGLMLHGGEFAVHSMIRLATRNPDFGNSPYAVNAMLRHIRRLPVPKLDKGVPRDVLV